MTKKLITADEVIEISFTDDETDPDVIKDAIIDVAEFNHILTALGDPEDFADSLYHEIQTENIAEALTPDNLTLLDEYIKPALAFYVKFEILEDLHIRTVNQGLQVNSSEFGTPASSSQRSDLSKRVFSHATALKEKMLSFLEENAAKYPKYVERGRNRTAGDIVGGIILGPRRIDDCPHDLFDHEGRPLDC